MEEADRIAEQLQRLRRKTEAALLTLQHGQSPRRIDAPYRAPYRLTRAQAELVVDALMTHLSVMGQQAKLCRPASAQCLELLEIAECARILREELKRQLQVRS